MRYKKFHKNDKMTGNIYSAFLRKLQKVKIEVTGPRKVIFLRMFSNKLTKNDQFISTLPVISSFMKFCVAQTFFVERHLDVVLEVHQVVGSKFLFNERFNKKLGIY